LTSLKAGREESEEIVSGGFMKKLALCFLLLVNSACEFNFHSSQANDSNRPSGSRDFKVDEAQVGIVVSLYGTSMGTPDGEAVSSILEMADSEGSISKTRELAQPIEGGVHECLEVPSLEKRQALLSRLQKVQTSMKDSTYKLESVASCSTVADSSVADQK
jgi:hypothetical protein